MKVYISEFKVGKLYKSVGIYTAYDKNEKHGPYGPFEEVAPGIYVMPKSIPLPKGSIVLCIKTPWVGQGDHPNDAFWRCRVLHKDTEYVLELPYNRVFGPKTDCLMWEVLT